MAEEILVTPPIRQSLEDINSARGNGLAQPLTEKSWYLYWHRMGQQLNDLRRGVIPASAPPGPASPEHGQLWFDTETHHLLIYISGAWFQLT